MTKTSAPIYLSPIEVAARLGVKPSTLCRYKLPAPDMTIGVHRGWLSETIDTWNAARPSRVRAAKQLERESAELEDPTKGGEPRETITAL
jgi:hypothetical protein